MAKKINYYTKSYFQKRDHLDLHIAESVKLIIDENKFQTVLDVGCGSGKLVNFFQKSGLVAYGCDIQKKAVQMARKINRKGTIKLASATSLPYQNSSFNLITSISTIEHLTKKEAGIFLKEARRVLKPKGIIFLITPNFNSPFRLLKGHKWFGYQDSTHITFFTPKTLSRLLEKNGFKTITTRPKTAYNISTNLHLPRQLHKAPMPIKNFANWLLVSSPFANYRDSFWITARKK